MSANTDNTSRKDSNVLPTSNQSTTNKDTFKFVSFRSKRTYFPNTSFRGNLEIPPKDTQPTSYSTTGGYVYKKR